jgi:hypothetical protein
MAVGIRHADHVAPSIRKKLALTSLTSGGPSVGIVRLRTEAMEFFLEGVVCCVDRFYRSNLLVCVSVYALAYRIVVVPSSGYVCLCVLVCALVLL